MTNNNELINKSAITTSSVTSGLLNKEQSKKFLKQVMENTAMGDLVRKELRASKTGEIDKIGIGKRLLRKKVENSDDGARNDVKFSNVEYSTVSVKLPWEITEETLRENIEGEGLEKVITELMSAQVGIDMEDLWFNGDTNTDSADEDYEFLKLNDGFIKIITDGGHVVDAKDESEMSLNLFGNALQSMPNKYNNGNLRWLVSPFRKQSWETELLNKAINVGGMISDKRIENPYSIPTIEVPCLPDDVIILCDPKNLLVVNTYDVKIRKTTEGKEAIMQDKRFYVIHLDFDVVVEELDATVIIKNLPEIK